MARGMLDGHVDMFSSEASPLATLAAIIGVVGAGLVAVLLLLVVAERVEGSAEPNRTDVRREHDRARRDGG